MSPSPIQLLSAGHKERKILYFHLASIRQNEVVEGRASWHLLPSLSSLGVSRAHRKLSSWLHSAATKWYESALGFPVPGVSRAQWEAELNIPIHHQQEDGVGALFLQAWWVVIAVGPEHIHPSGLLLQLLKKKNQRKNVKQNPESYKTKMYRIQ